MDTTFIDDLASSAPTPGGGGASAYVGALASALASMVGELTVGKAKYADVEGEVIGSLGRLAIFRARLLELIEEDARAFRPLAAAYSMPKDTEEEKARKSEAMQAALVEACDVPIEIMRVCVDVLHECEHMAKYGSRMAISDAGAAAILAEAALRAASLNVYINVSSISDAARADGYLLQTSSLKEIAGKLSSSVEKYVNAALGIEDAGC